MKETFACHSQFCRYHFDKNYNLLCYGTYPIQKKWISKTSISRFQEFCSTYGTVLTSIVYLVSASKPNILVITVPQETSTNVTDPDPGSGAFLTPGSGIRDG
jgi:hypothetical protein